MLVGKEHLLDSAVFIWQGSASCKKNLGKYVRPLSVSSGNWEFGASALWLVCHLNCYQFPSTTTSLCLYIFMFPNH